MSIYCLEVKTAVVFPEFEFNEHTMLTSKDFMLRLEAEDGTVLRMLDIPENWPDTVNTHFLKKKGYDIVYAAFDPSETV